MARLNHVKSFRGTSKTVSGELLCGKCNASIKKGDPYRWWANKLPGQGRGSGRRVRCMAATCTPTIAEMTPGRRGQWYGMQDAFATLIAGIQSHDDLESTAQDIGGEIRDFAQEFLDSAENMEQGFGHSTYQSDELREKGETIEAVADELDGYLDFEEPEERNDDEDDDGFQSEDEYAQYLETHLEDQRQKIQDKIDEVDV